MADDPCSVVKSDLEAGTYSLYTDSFPIYILGKTKFEGGNTFIELDNGRRAYEQTISGSRILPEKRCEITIRSQDADKRDDLFEDVLDILLATNRSYTILDIRDDNETEEIFRTKILVRFLR